MGGSTHGVDGEAHRYVQRALHGVHDRLDRAGLEGEHEDAGVVVAGHGEAVVAPPAAAAAAANHA